MKLLPLWLLDVIASNGAIFLFVVMSLIRFIVRRGWCYYSEYKMCLVDVLLVSDAGFRNFMAQQQGEASHQLTNITALACLLPQHQNNRMSPLACLASEFQPPAGVSGIRT